MKIKKCHNKECSREGVAGKEFYGVEGYSDSYCVECRKTMNRRYYHDVVKPRRLAARILKKAGEQ